MKSILFRIIAVVVVLVLIVNLSPIRAQASALPEAVGVVTKVIPFAKVVEPAALGVGGTAFCWVAAGLGVLFTAAQAVNAYNDYQDFTGDLETSIYYYPDGSWSYGVDMAFIDRVRAFLFDSGTITTLEHFLSTGSLDSLAGYISSFQTAFGVSPHCYWYTLDGNIVYFFLTDSPVTLIDGYYYPTSGARAWRLVYNGSSLIKNDGVYSKLSDPGVPLLLASSSFVSSADFELMEVASPNKEFPGAYPVWYANACPAVDPDTQDEIIVLPIPLNPSADPETQIGTLTQPDIWQGSIADPMPEPEPAPNPGTETDPDGSLSNTPWDAVKKWAADFFIPSGDITIYSLDLTELFPFCIPFDIFDLLSALKADPVAPVFELELDFGVTKAPITVDLSGWSDLASIVRILEVGLFCLGLALGTKELIGS